VSASCADAVGPATPMARRAVAAARRCWIFMFSPLVAVRRTGSRTGRQ
jgi:hypothetical protein